MGQMATSLGRSGEIWSSYSASVSKWGPKIPFKEGPGSFAAPMHPRRAQEWAEWGQVGPAAACLHAGSCVRNASCCPGRGMLTASSSCTENIQVWAENLPCMKHLLWFQGTLCGCRGWGCDPVLYLKLKNVSEWRIILTNVYESCGKYLWQRKVLPIIKF